MKTTHILFRGFVLNLDAFTLPKNERTLELKEAKEAAEVANGAKSEFLLHTSTQNLLTIIKDLPDFSKIEAGEMQLEKLDFVLESCVEEVVDLLSTQAKCLD